MEGNRAGQGGAGADLGGAAGRPGRGHARVEPGWGRGTASSKAAQGLAQGHREERGRPRPEARPAGARDGRRGQAAAQ